MSHVDWTSQLFSRSIYTGTGEGRGRGSYTVSTYVLVCVCVFKWPCSRMVVWCLVSCPCFVALVTVKECLHADAGTQQRWNASRKPRSLPSPPNLRTLTNLIQLTTDYYYPEDYSSATHQWNITHLHLTPPTCMATSCWYSRGASTSKQTYSFMLLCWDRPDLAIRRSFNIDIFTFLSS